MQRKKGLQTPNPKPHTLIPTPFRLSVMCTHTLSLFLTHTLHPTPHTLIPKPQTPMVESFDHQIRFSMQRKTGLSDQQIIDYLSVRVEAGVSSPLETLQSKLYRRTEDQRSEDFVPGGG